MAPRTNPTKAAGRAARRAVAERAALTADRPRPAHCPRCGALVLRAVLDIAGARGPETDADPMPITTAAECAALIRGTQVLAYHRDRIEARPPEHIGTPRTTPVLARHHCGQTHETEAADIPKVWPTPPAQPDPTQPPPY